MIKYFRPLPKHLGCESELATAKCDVEPETRGRRMANTAPEVRGIGEQKKSGSAFDTLT
jgi:hypothetical protein